MKSLLRSSIVALLVFAGYAALASSSSSSFTGPLHPAPLSTSSGALEIEENSVVMFVFYNLQGQ